jgi:hypothetical protein
MFRLMGEEEIDDLRRENERLRCELARSQARERATRIVYGSELQVLDDLLGEAVPSPLRYAWDTHDHQVVRMRVGERVVAVVLGPSRDGASLSELWDAIERIADEG